MTDTGDAERLAILEHCNDDILALLREAAADGVPLEEAVVLVADSNDALGRKAVEACSELGMPMSGADVFVVGVHVSLAEEVLRRVAPEHVEDLHEPAPEGASHLLCFAAGGVRSSFTAPREMGRA